MVTHRGLFQIVVPYQALEMHTKVLSRLHLASHILRQVNRIQSLSKKLTNTSDPVQKATILQELGNNKKLFLSETVHKTSYYILKILILEQLTADSDLMDIDAVTNELRNIRSQQQKVVKLAMSSLTQGITSENLTQTTTALQVGLTLCH